MKTHKRVLLKSTIRDKQNDTILEAVHEYKMASAFAALSVLRLVSKACRLDKKMSQSEDGQQFYETVRLDSETLEALKAINKVRGKLENFATSLPLSWPVMAELASLSEDEFISVFQAGVVHPFMAPDMLKQTVAEIRKGAERQSNAKPKSKRKRATKRRSG
jgi:hypothetical protein